MLSDDPSKSKVCLGILSVERRNNQSYLTATVMSAITRVKPSQLKDISLYIFNLNEDHG